MTEWHPSKTCPPYLAITLQIQLISSRQMIVTIVSSLSRSNLQTQGLLIVSLIVCMNKPTWWDGHWYFSSYNPIAGHQITYQLPSRLFLQSDPAHCYTTDWIQKELARDPSATSLTYNINTSNMANLEALTVWKGMWVLNCYEALLLKENLTPVNVWTRLYGAMCTKGLLLFCATLVNYLRFQLLGNVPLNTVIDDGDDIVQPQIYDSLPLNCLSSLKHLASSSVTATS